MNFFSIDDVPTYCDISKNGVVVVFDTETTGFHNHDDVVQLAVVVSKEGKERIAKAVYLKNQIPIDGTPASEVNGITDALLAEQGLDPKEVLQDFLVLLGEAIAEYGKVLVVGHNLAFDYRMMSNMFSRYGLSGFPKGTIWCCTKEFVKALSLPPDFLSNNKLATCISTMSIKGENSHDALDDAKATMELFRFLTN